MRVNFTGQEAGKALDGAGFGVDSPVLRNWIVHPVGAGNFSPAIELVFAHSPKEHRYWIQIQVLARGQGIQRPLQFSPAGNQFLHVLLFAAFVIDDDAIVSELINAIDAPFDVDATGEFQRQIYFRVGGIRRPKVVVADAPGNFAKLYSLDFEPVPRRQVLGAACVVERRFKMFDKITALIGQPTFEGGVQNRTGDAGLDSLVGAFGGALQRERFPT